MTEENVVSQVSQKDPHYSNCSEEILALIKGRAPIIYVLTHEETRFIEEFNELVAKPLNRKVWLWSSYQGLVPVEQQLSIARASGDEAETWNPQKALNRIAEMSGPIDKIKGQCYIMRDFHTVLGEPIPRQI